MPWQYVVLPLPGAPMTSCPKPILPLHVRATNRARHISLLYIGEIVAGDELAPGRAAMGHGSPSAMELEAADRRRHEDLVTPAGASAASRSRTGWLARSARPQVPPGKRKPGGSVPPRAAAATC